VFSEFLPCLMERHRAERLSVALAVDAEPQRAVDAPVGASVLDDVSGCGRAIRHPRRVVAWRCSLGAATSFGRRARCSRGARAHFSMGCARLGDYPAARLRRFARLLRRRARRLSCCRRPLSRGQQTSQLLVALAS
jgi:hypothetical protein